MSTVQAAARYARNAHAGQVDRAGRDYFTAHISDVADRVRAAGGGDDAVMAAYLHDTVEDTATTPADLRAAGFPAAVVDAVVTLTRRGGEGYEAFIDRVAADPLARTVKIADLLSNTDPGRVAELARRDPATARRLAQRYDRALRTLRAEAPPA